MKSLVHGNYLSTLDCYIGNGSQGHASRNSQEEGVRCGTERK